MVSSIKPSAGNNCIWGKNCHRISNECSKETLRMESQVGWLWELLIISLRIKMLLCNSIVGVSNPFFFFIQLPYFYSLNSFFPNLSSPGVLCQIFNDNATHFSPHNEICAVFLKTKKGKTFLRIIYEFFSMLHVRSDYILCKM